MKKRLFHFPPLRLFGSILLLICFAAQWTFTAPAVQASTWMPPQGQPVRVADLHKGIASSSPNLLTPLGTTLFFVATESEHGSELYKSYPPYTSVELVMDINPGTASSDPAWMTVQGDTLIFSANDGVHGFELWQSTPPYTATTTVMAVDINPTGDGDPSNLKAIGDAVFFQGDDGESGPELWISQTPFFSARRIADIFPGPTGSKPYDLTPIGWNLFFITANGGYGAEVWISEPPYLETTTRRMADIYPTGNADPGELTPLGTTLFFRAVGSGDGSQLWKSDPPYDGNTTVQVSKTLDLTPTHPPSWFPQYKGSEPSKFKAVGSTLFFSSNVNTIGFELWKSYPDYSLTSTARVDDINEGSYNPLKLDSFSSYPDQLTSINSTLFFRASDGRYGYQLWKTVPPYDKAEKVALIRHGSTGCVPDNLTVMGQTLFFTATDINHGQELWKSEPPYDAINTVLMTDIQHGGENSWVNNLTVIGDILFFRANDGEHGVELYKLDTKLKLPDTGFAPGVVTHLRAQPPAKAYTSTNDMRLIIPSQKVNVPLLGVPTVSGGWDLSWLGMEAGYLDGTAFPTTAGNSVITGHAYLPNGRPGPFINLGSLKWGDQIIVPAWGEQYVYEVRSVQTVEDRDLTAFEHEEKPWLTLITCQGYDETLKGYRYRIVVKAVLVSIQ